MTEKLIFETYTKPELKQADTSNFRQREAARGVVILPNGKLPIFCKSTIGLYKVPGGGMEKDETPEQAFVREVYEETGYHVKNVRPVGYTLEAEDDYKQISHVFMADADAYSGSFHPDAGEIEAGAECLELTPEEALAKMRAFLDNPPKHLPDRLAHICNVANRDYHILQHCLKLT